jgi:triacylglycerol lipase
MPSETDRPRALPRASTIEGLRALHAPRRDRAWFDGAARRPFRAAADAFDARVAWRLAEASALVYVDDAAYVEAAFSRIGARRVVCRGFVPEAKSEAVVATFDDAAWIVFRGTEPNDPRDFLTDLDVRLAAFPGEGRVHAGFLAALDDRGLYAALAADFASVAGPVFLAGHSLGGGLAILAAARFVAEGVVPAARLRVVAFGCPRPGDAAFAAAYPVRAWRVVHGRDLVPSLPPRRLGYRHVGDPFGTDGAPITVPAPDLDLAASFRTWFDRHERLAPLVDHAPTVYADALWNATLPPPKPEGV